MQEKTVIPHLSFNKKAVIATIVTTTLIMIDHYVKISPIKELDRVVLYLFVPLGVIYLIFHESPKDYGFQFGDWRMGLIITGGAVLILAPILWLVVRYSPGMQAYYNTGYDAQMPLLNLIDLVGWEFVFRGFLLFAYLQAFGDNALWLQAVPFALAHLGKPPLETYTTLFGGFLFGLVARQTRSFIYPFLIHFFVATLVSFFATIQPI